MGPSLIQRYEAGRKLADKPFRSACYAPFNSLYFNTNGDVVSCCKNTTYVLGNVARDGLDDIWNGKRTAALRKSLKRYVFGLGCEFCAWQIEGSQHHQAYAKIFDQFSVESETPLWPSFMEFTVSNTCNLACVMCTGDLSSTIRAQRENRPPLPRAYGEEFFQDLRKYLPHLEMANFLGGEPFLAQENYRIWDMMIEDGISIPCHVTTNGTQWGPRVLRILEHFPVHVSISFDGATKKTVESIRVNVDFDRLLEVTGRFRDYTREKGTELTLAYCLMRENWQEFGEFLRLAEKLRAHVFVNVVVEPTERSLYTLSPAELQDIASGMKKQNRFGRYSRLRRNGKHWRSSVAALLESARNRRNEALEGAQKSARDRRSKSRPDPIGRAWENIAAGRFEQAIDELRRVPSTDARVHEAACCEAHAQRRAGRLDAAEEAIDRALKLWKRGPSAYVERAWLRLEQQRHGDGVADAVEARRLLRGGELGDVEAQVCHVLSALRLSQGEKQDALAESDQALALAPGNAALWVHRAYVHQSLGRPDRSLEDARAALGIDPDHREAQQLVERLSEQTGE